MTSSSLFLNDAGSNRQLLIRGEHVSAVELLRDKRIIVLHMSGGETLPLTNEESRQFLQHTHHHTQAKATEAGPEELIRRRANRAWRSAGKPEGNGVSFWLEAERALQQEK